MGLIDRQTAIDGVLSIGHIAKLADGDAVIRVSAVNYVLKNLPSAEPVRCKDCKHNPKDEWFGCPMSHLSEAQRPETAWCWKAERRTDAETEV